MPITSNSIHNNQGHSAGAKTSSANRTFRSGNSTITVREGETLKGVVSDIHGNAITISMEDGSSFTGRLPDASQYSIGQKAAFLITGLDNGTIYMKAMSQSYLLGMEDTIEQALEEAGLPKSPRNLEIVRSLLSNGQSISRDNIANSLQFCAKYPEADVNSVITMKRLNFPMDSTTVTQFDQYMKQSHQLLSRAETLGDNINHLLTQLSDENPAIAGHAANEVLDMLLSAPPSLEEYEQMIAKAAQKDAAAMVSQSQETDANQEVVDQDLSELAIPDEEVADESSLASPLARVKQILTNITERTLLDSEVSSASKDAFIPEQTGHLLSTDERLALSELTSRFSVSPEFLAELERGDMTAREFLSQMKQLLPTLSDTETHVLLTSKEFQKVMKGQLLSEWTLSPKALKEKGSVDALYQRMNQQIEELSSLSRMFATRPAGEAVVHSTTDLQQNMSFMKLLNEQFAYMQLPLKLSEENAHGDLYVMTRKNTPKKSGDKLRVLLHLEMDALGMMDIHLTKEGTSITTQFYIEKDAARKLLEKNAELLSDSINQQGFQFSSDFLAKEKDIDLVHDFMEPDAVAPPVNVTRYNFDLRA